jgi:hypothetical protein
MANLNGFNAHDVEPNDNFEAIPAGKYIAAIVASETKPTKTGNGSFLELTFQVLEGEYHGRKLWARLNLDNPNPQAVQIARGELSAICRAIGVMTPQDSLELHNLPMQITVKCKKRDDTGDINNEIKGYAPKNAAPSGAQTQQQATAASGGTYTGSTPPWKR